MSEQSKALMLAEQIEARNYDLHLNEVVVELRRLDNEVKVLKRIIENCKTVSDATAEGWRLDQEKFDATEALNTELVEVLRSTGLFLHHLWCDVQMNDYSFQKLNEQMEIVDKVLKK